MKVDRRRIQQWARRSILLLSLLGTLYLFLRFDLRTIPREGCSPLLRFVPGDRLIVDGWDRRPKVGEAVLFRPGDEHGTLLGRIDARRESERGEGAEYWVIGDRPDCPTPDSRVLCWIPQRAVTARILMPWPW
jgi:hypothetical protein